MTQMQTLNEYTDQTAQVLSGVVDQWLENLHDQTNACRRTVSLPIRPVTKNWLELHEFQTRIPESYLNIDKESVRNSVAIQLRKIDVSCLIANSDLVRKLSNLAYETASFDILIGEIDSFEVSAWSACLVCSTANLFFLAETLKTSSKENAEQLLKQVSQLQKHVTTPLLIATQFENEMLPGDVWLSDLLIRSAFKGLPKLIQSENDSSKKKLLQKTLPPLLATMISTSLTQKLFSGDQLPKAMQPFLDFKRWVGLKTLVEHSGAASLRELISLETCQSFSRFVPQQQFVALQNLMESIANFNNIELQHRQKFAGSLLADWFTLEPRLVEEIAGLPTGRSAIETGVRLMETPAHQPESRRLDQEINELRETLRQFPIYDQFRRLNEQLQAIGGSQINISSEISD